MRTVLCALAPAVALALGLALPGCDEAPPPDPVEPVLIEVVPASAPPGRWVELRGANFGEDPAVGRVLFGGVDAPIDADLWSDSALSARVPDAPAGARVVVVEIAGQVTNALSFTVEPSP